MSEKKVQWYMGNMLAKFDVERAAWTSVQAPTDFNHAEFLLTPDSQSGRRTGSLAWNSGACHKG